MSTHLIKFANGDQIVAEVQTIHATSQEPPMMMIYDPMSVFEWYDRHCQEVVVKMTKFLEFGTDRARIPWSAVQVVADPSPEILAMYRSAKIK